jgi:hypothetical protein
VTVLVSDVAAAVSAAASRHGIDACILAALVVKESSGDPLAVRHEPRYQWLWDVDKWEPFRRLSEEERRSATPPPDFRAPVGVSAATEWSSQRTSWGACQIMGATARERGFRGRFLSALCEPTLGVEYGARHLALLMARYDAMSALSAYNAGKPTDANEDSYVRPILRWAEEFRREGF